MNRKDDLQSIRPSIQNILDSVVSDEEYFQNNTLRPILKFQNELLIAVFQHHIKTRKDVFYKLDDIRQVEYMKNTIKTDAKLQHLLMGIVIGQFTLEEYATYLKNTAAIKKRMRNLIEQRLVSQVELL